MLGRRVNPNLVKRNRSYTASELAARLGVHKNTVRHWQRDGLAAIDGGRPTLFHGRGRARLSSPSETPAGSGHARPARSTASGAASHARRRSAWSTIVELTAGDGQPPRALRNLRDDHAPARPSIGARRRDAGNRVSRSGRLLHAYRIAPIPP